MDHDPLRSFISFQMHLQLDPNKRVLSGLQNTPGPEPGPELKPMQFCLHIINLCVKNIPMPVYNKMIILMIMGIAWAIGLVKAHS